MKTDCLPERQKATCHAVSIRLRILGVALVLLLLGYAGAALALVYSPRRAMATMTDETGKTFLSPAVAVTPDLVLCAADVEVPNGSQFGVSGGERRAVVRVRTAQLTDNTKVTLVRLATAVDAGSVRVIGNPQQGSPARSDSLKGHWRGTLSPRAGTELFDMQPPEPSLGSGAPVFGDDQELLGFTVQFKTDTVVAPMRFILAILPELKAALQ
jgi:hypothetical protein